MRELRVYKGRTPESGTPCSPAEEQVIKYQIIKLGEGSGEQGRGQQVQPPMINTQTEIGRFLN